MDSTKLKDDDKNCNCTLLVMMGLPAGGKSSLSSFIEESYSKNVNIIKLSYDEFVTLQTQANSSKTQVTKILRGNYLKSIYFLAKLISEKEQETIKNIWIEFEKELSSDAAEFVPKNEFIDKISDIYAKAKNASTIFYKFILIIDDNNYYHSMRNEVYQIAKDLHCGYLIFYLSTPVQVCLKRNSERDAQFKVPDQVILDMKTKLEEPNPMTNTCDTFSFAVDGSEDFSHLTSMLEVIIENSFNNPIIGPEDRTEEIQRERKQCSESEIHQADLVLRKWVKSQITLTSFGSKKNVSTLANELNQRKNDILGKLKSGELKVKSDLKAHEEIEFSKEILDFVNKCTNIC